MATANNIAVGLPVWVGDEKLVWAEGVVVQVSENKVTVSKNGSTITISLSSCHPKDPDAPSGGVDDMTKLAYLHEPGVLYNLCSRYAIDEIYTYTGSILIAVNPFIKLPHLYDIPMMDQYRGMRLGELSPHVFAIADAAYRAMVDDYKSQSILVSGESGAGKTETTKLIMQYLAYMGGRSNTETRSVESQVLESNPLLEAFGNAKTVRNNNSSRFGKFVELQFDKNGRISGAAVRTYLLERSRVVQISDPERNYHCFYQLCYGATPEEVQRYKLAPAETFHYLNQSKCFELPGKESNAKEYLNTKRAMDIVGLSAEEQESIFRVVASILHLGNIEFVHGDDPDTSKLKNEKSKFHLEAVAELLNCDLTLLEESLVTRTLMTREGNIKRGLDPQSALTSRDTLAKTIYSRLFDWLVNKINVSIGQDPDCKNLIGVLDIYGFESFQTNSFEQFCINLANEKLQQHFNQHVFKAEQEEYEKEKINWSYIEFVDNTDVLELIEKKPVGIIALLDEQCMFPRASHETFSTKLYQTLRNHKRFSKPKLSPTDFTVEHYAGAVTYQTELFLDKNKDYVVAEHQSLLGTSTCPFVASLFPPVNGEKAKTKFTSLGTSFKQQLSSLMETLNMTEPHYIRCVKPNAVNRPGLFENENVLQQLRCGGVLEAVRISCAGYPTRRTFDEFLDRFGILMPALLDSSLSEKEAVVKLLDKMGLKNYQVGLTKVFLRAGQMAELDARRAELLNEAAKKIQRAFCSWYQRRKYLRLRKAALLAQARWRGILARRKYLVMRQEAAALKIQKHVRRFICQKRFQKLRWTTILLQSYLRAKAARKLHLFLRQTKAAITIQACWRRKVAESNYKKLCRGALVVQCLWRGKVARKELKKLKMEARQTGALQEAKTKLEKQCEELTWRLQLEKKLRLDAEEAKAQEILKLQASLDEALHSVEEIRTQSQSQEKQLLEKFQAELVVAEKQIAEKYQAESFLSERHLLDKHEKVAAESPRASEKHHHAHSAEKHHLLDKYHMDKQPPSPSVSLSDSAIKFSDITDSSSDLMKNVIARAEKLEVENNRLKSLLEESDSRAASMESQLTEAMSKAEKFETVENNARELQESLSRLEDQLKNLQQENQVLRQQTLTLTPPKSMNLTRNSIPFFQRQSENGFTTPEPTKPVPLSPSDSMERQQVDFDLKRQKQLVDRQQSDQELLLQCVSTELGYDKDRPLAACLVYKSLLHWRSFESERTNVFDRIVQTISNAMETHQENNEMLAYWLSNTCTLLFLLQRTLKAGGTSANPHQRRRATNQSFFGRMSQSFRASPITSMAPNGPSNLDAIRQVDAKYPALLFKQQLSAVVEKIYGILRDNVKKEITPMLGSCIQAPRMSRSMGRNARSPSASNSMVLSSHWSSIISTLTHVLEIVKKHHILPFIIQKLFAQLFSFINIQLFNSLLLRRECCSFSNGEYVKTGLAELEQWIYTAKEEYAGASLDELKYIRQAVGFLVIHKPKKSLDEITNELCPVLSIQQLYRISTMYWDDKYGTHSVSAEVIANMRALMTEDANQARSNSFLLDDDSSIPFSADDIAKFMPSIQLSELDPPLLLQENSSFTFLSTTGGE